MNLKGRARTLQKFALNWKGVKLLICLPKNIRKWTGSKEGFKNVIDNFLEGIPDQPEIPGDKPGGRTLTGDVSNSIPDWLHVLDLDDGVDNLRDDDGDDEDDPAIDGGETSNINVLSSVVGPGLSPGHGLL